MLAKFGLILLFVLARAQASVDCAVLLGSDSSSIRKLNPDQKFQAYFSDLLDETVLGMEELVAFKENLEEGGEIVNPITELVELMRDGAWVHRHPLQVHIDTGELSVLTQLEWAEAELARRDYNWRRREVTEEDTRVVREPDVTSQEWWETATDRELRHIDNIHAEFVGQGRDFISTAGNHIVYRMVGPVGKMRAIHFAAEYAPYKKFKKFIEIYRRELNIDVADGYGNTALWRALWRGRLDIAGLLLMEGANIEVKDTTGYTPLIMAVHIRDEKLVEFLLELGADVHARDKLGYTAFHRAMRDARPSMVVGVEDIRDGSLPIAELLLARGAEIDTKNELGGTPMRDSSWENHEEMVEFLRERGVEYGPEDENARGWGQWDVVTGNTRGKKFFGSIGRRFRIFFQIVMAEFRR